MDLMFTLYDHTREQNIHTRQEIIEEVKTRQVWTTNLVIAFEWCWPSSSCYAET